MKYCQLLVFPTGAARGGIENWPYIVPQGGQRWGRRLGSMSTNQMEINTYMKFNASQRFPFVSLLQVWLCSQKRDAPVDNMRAVHTTAPLHPPRRATLHHNLLPNMERQLQLPQLSRAVKKCNQIQIKELPNNKNNK